MYYQRPPPVVPSPDQGVSPWPSPSPAIETFHEICPKRALSIMIRARARDGLTVTSRSSLLPSPLSKPCLGCHRPAKIYLLTHLRDHQKVSICKQNLSIELDSYSGFLARLISGHSLTIASGISCRHDGCTLVFAFALDTRF